MMMAVVMVVMVPMSRHPVADLAMVPAAVPEMSADEADLLDQGLIPDRVGMFDRWLVAGSRHSVGAARQRAGCQHRDACDQRQAEFAHILLHMDSSRGIRDLDSRPLVQS
jgi:hypothetical protein